MERINKKKVLSIALVLTVLFSMFAVVAPTGAETLKSRNKVGAVERIQADYKAQKITIDEYILNKAWAVFKPEKLSGTKYVLSAEDAKFRKSGTPTILEIKKNWNKLSQETQDILQCNILLRPDDGLICEGSIVDTFPSTFPSAHFIVHYNTSGANAVTLAYATKISSYFETAYTEEVTNLGYNAPPSDLAASNNGGDGKYDVYIYDLGTGLYGYTCPEQSPATPSYSYIAVNKSYSWAPPNDDPIPADGAAKVTAAHEFFHAVQFSYDANEEVWWMETTSTYMEDVVWPAVNDNYNYLPYWFQFSDSYGLETFDGGHEYGNFIFAKRLSEDFSGGGDAIIKEIWEQCQTTDGLTAINTVLGGYGSSIIDEFNVFTEANFFLEDMYTDGADYRAKLTGTTFDGVWLEYQYDAVTDGIPFTIDSTNVNYDAWMDKWATDYVTIALDPAVANYWVYFNGLDNTTDYSVNLVTEKAGIRTDHPFSLDAHKDGYVDLAYDTYDNVVLIIMNAGDTSTTNPSWAVSLSRNGAGSVWLDRDSYSAGGVVNVTVLDGDLNTTGGPDTTTVKFTSTTEAVAEVKTLTETGNSTGIFTGSINLEVGTAAADGKLQVHHNDIITVTYHDADDGTGNPADVEDTALFSLISVPTGLTATAGRTYVSLRWNSVVSSVLAGYNVYRSTSLTGIKEKVNGAVITNNYFYDISTLTPATTYYYWVTAVDTFGIDTDYSSPCMITTMAEGDTGDGSGGDGSGGGGGGGGGAGSLSGCFIATACYGTPMAREVRVLSEFRDDYLLTNSLGKIFVGTYYKVGPRIASFISEHPRLKTVVRWSLKPLVKIVDLMD